MRPGTAIGDRVDSVGQVNTTEITASLTSLFTDLTAVSAVVLCVYVVVVVVGNAGMKAILRKQQKGSLVDHNGGRKKEKNSTQMSGHRF